MERYRLVRRWARLVFVDGWDGRRHRRASDVARVLGGLAAIGALGLAVQLPALGLPSGFLPDLVRIGLAIVAWLGLALPGLAVGLVAGLAGRWVLVVTAVVAAVLAAGVESWLDPGHAVPSAVVAAAWAAAMVVWPLCRPTVHRWFTVGMLAWAVLLLDAGDASWARLLQAVAVGFAVGCAGRLVTGTSEGDPVEAARAAAADLGWDLHDVTAVPDRGAGERFEAVTDGGTPVVVDMYGRDYAQAQLGLGMLRFVWYRGAHLPVTSTRLQYLEHHIALLGQANAAGASDFALVACGLAGPTADAVVVCRRPEAATALAELPPEAAGDLAALWATLRSLAGVGVAHRAVSTRTVTRDGDGRWLLDDLREATLAAREQDLLADRAALLVATARRFGVDQACAAARDALGTDGLAEVIPLLQASALPRPPGAERHDKGLLTDLRAAASQAAGVEVPDLAKLARVSPATLAMTLGTLLGLWILVGQLADLSDVGDVLAGAEWGWLVAAFVVGLLPNLSEAAALAGAVPEPLPFRPLVMLRLADGFLGLIGGTVATTAAAIRFFQLRGLVAAIAVTSGLLYSVTGFVDQLVLSAISLIPAHDDFTFSGSAGTSGSEGGGGGDLRTVLLLGVGLLVLVGIALAVPRVRRPVLAKTIPQVTGARESLRQLAGQPTKLVQLFGANAVSQLLFAACLGLCLRGFGAPTGVAVLILVNTAAAFLGGIAPIPGGMGVIEAGLIAGLTAAGVPQDQAIAGTFAYRLITAYLPPIWGWPAMLWLRRRDYL